ncbi:MAG: hypothetical protein IJM24_06465 [Clostridia bacterium]|nr:hypothetical protein [Clostridia bacterium]
MTELETLQRAKMYLDKLANGIDPLTDVPVPDNDCINQIRISRCLFYVSDILKKLIESGGFIEKLKKRKTSFAISQERLTEYKIEEKPITVSEIARKINGLVDLDAVSKLKYSSITSFLIQNGFLVEQVSAEGKKAKIPTDCGINIGIFREERAGRDGPYYVTVYNAEAQRFILDNIYAIIEFNGPQK